MDTKNIETSSWLDIGYGLKLGESEGVWLVESSKGIFNLIDDSDYFRVVTLLERPYEQVADLITGYQIRKKLSHTFPIEKLVKVALIAKSEQWAERAILWLPYLSDESKKTLALDIQEVINSKWANQKTRQLASREVNKM
jgi:hypothetical protein